MNFTDYLFQKMKCFKTMNVKGSKFPILNQSHYMLNGDVKSKRDLSLCICEDKCFPKINPLSEVTTLIRSKCQVGIVYSGQYLVCLRHLNDRIYNLCHL